MAKESMLVLYIRFYLYAACIGAVIGVVRVALGYTSDLSDPGSRFAVLVGMFLSALLYHKIEDTAWKLAIGFAEIAAAMLSNYYQLERLATATTQQAAFDRLAFLVGGVLLLAKGIKDVAKGQFMQKNYRAMSQPSSGTR